mgnify:CR=1 FL=1
MTTKLPLGLYASHDAPWVFDDDDLEDVADTRDDPLSDPSMQRRYPYVLISQSHRKRVHMFFSHKPELLEKLTNLQSLHAVLPKHLANAPVVKHIAAGDAAAMWKSSTGCLTGAWSA